MKMNSYKFVLKYMNKSKNKCVIWSIEVNNLIVIINMVMLDNLEMDIDNNINQDNINQDMNKDKIIMNIQKKTVYM